MRSRARVVSILTAASLVLGLAACVPEAKPASGGAASVDVAKAFSTNGIAIVPFGGGDPVRDVTGDTVLVLTDWQVDNIQGGMRGSGATISLEALDAAAPAKADEFEPVFTPSQVLLAWWGFAESARADLAREAYPAPALNAAIAVPIYVMVLFEADTFDDFGRTSADTPVAAGPADRSYALGSDAVFALDACGIVGQAIDDVNGFLASVGAPPRVVGTAVDVAYNIVNGLTGGALDYFHKVIGVMNIVMTIGSLITPWKIEQTLTSDVFRLGLNGVQGDGGVVVFSITGVTGQPPAEVKSCLELFGLKDPTSLKGTTFQVAANEGVYAPSALGIQPSWLVVDYEPGKQYELDENNTATIGFTTGMQTIDPKDTEVQTLFQDAWIYFFDIKRSDVGQISKWIRTAVDNQAYSILLGASVNDLADRIEVAANPLVTPTYVPVSFLVPKKPVGDTGQSQDDAPPVADPEVKEGIGDCLSVTYIETLTGHTVNKHFVETPAVYSTISGAPTGVTALPPKDTCIYDLDNSWRLQIVWPYTIWDDGALDLFLVGNVDDAPNNCSRIGGGELLDAPGDAFGAETSSYFVWDGLNLATMLMTGVDSAQHKAWLGAMAKDIGWCERPVMIDWAWNKPN